MSTTNTNVATLPEDYTGQCFSINASTVQKCC